MKVPNPKQVLQAVSDVCQVPIPIMQGKSRNAKVQQAREIFVYICRKLNLDGYMEAINRGSGKTQQTARGIPHKYLYYRTKAKLGLLTKHEEEQIYTQNADTYHILDCSARGHTCYVIFKNDDLLCCADTLRQANERIKADIAHPNTRL